MTVSPHTSQREDLASKNCFRGRPDCEQSEAAWKGSQPSHVLRLRTKDFGTLFPEIFGLPAPCCIVHQLLHGLRNKDLECGTSVRHAGDRDEQNAAGLVEKVGSTNNTCQYTTCPFYPC